jgi:methyltransferase family protein
MRETRAVRWLRAARKQSTVPSLPYNLADAGSPRWEQRAEAAVDLLVSNLDTLRWDASAGLSIADFGAGDERLGRVLASRLAQQHRYTGFDIRPQRKSVIELDLMAALPTQPFDVVCCLGLLEYIEPLDTFLARLAVRYPALILSYTVFDAPAPLSRRQRRSRGWLTDYTKAGLERELEAAGLAVREVVMTNQQRTCLWFVLSRTASTADHRRC